MLYSGLCELVFLGARHAVRLATENWDPPTHIRRRQSHAVRSAVAIRR